MVMKAGVGVRKSGGATADMRQALVEAALALIDEAGGCRGVTLRAIAARAGCAHTNAYNYFPSLERLFWAALLEAQRRSVEAVGRRLAQVAPGTPEVLGTFVAAMLDFAQSHPGWYRLIWLEPIGEEPPPEAVPHLVRPRQRLTELVQPLLGPGVSLDEARRATDLLHSYLHGEICKLLSKRDLADQDRGEPHRIVENSLRLLHLLRAELAGATEKGEN